MEMSKNLKNEGVKMKKIILVLMIVLSTSLFAKSENNEFASNIREIKENIDFPQKVDSYLYWLDLYLNDKGILMYEYQIVKKLSQQQIETFKKNINNNMLKVMCMDESIYNGILLKNQKEVNVVYRYEGKNLVSLKLTKDICKKYR